MSTLEQLLKNHELLKQKIDTAYKEMQEQSSVLIEAAAKQLFEVAPEITKVFWTQYTPYFNDGEPCEFNVGEVYYVLEDDESDDAEGSYLYTEDDLVRAKEKLADVQFFISDRAGWEAKFKEKYKLAKLYVPWDYKSEDAVHRAQQEVDTIITFMEKYDSKARERIDEAFDSFYSVITAIPDDVMKSIYGDHVRISITSSGTAIEEYSHD